MELLGPNRASRQLRCSRRDVRGMPLDLSDEEKRALADLLRRTIEADHYPQSPRVRVLQAILDTIEPPPVREPVPPPKVYAPPRAGRQRR